MILILKNVCVCVIGWSDLELLVRPMEESESLLFSLSLYTSFFHSLIQPVCPLVRAAGTLFLKLIPA